MIEQDCYASELCHRQEIVRMKFMPYNKTAKVLQPGKKPFHLPAPTIAPQCPPILSLAPFTPVGGDHFYPPILFQLGVELVTIVSLVADQMLRQFVGKATAQRVFNQSYLMRRRACHVNGERKTSSVCHCHDLGALAALGFTNGTTPFFAGANVPSICFWLYVRYLSDSRSKKRELKIRLEAIS